MQALVIDALVEHKVPRISTVFNVFDIPMIDKIHDIFFIDGNGKTLRKRALSDVVQAAIKVYMKEGTRLPIRAFPMQAIKLVNIVEKEMGLVFASCEQTAPHLMIEPTWLVSRIYYFNESTT